MTIIRTLIIIGISTQGETQGVGFNFETMFTRDEFRAVGQL